MDQDLIAYLVAMEQRLFSAMEQRFDGMEQRFDGMEQRSNHMEQRMDRMEQRFSQEIRQVHVVVEGLHDKIQLMAEGIMNVNEKLDRHRDEVSQRFTDLESLVRSSDRALASRVSDLEQKIKLAS